MQPSRQPASISSGESAARISSVTGTSPARTRTLQPPHCETPAQGNSTPFSNNRSLRGRCAGRLQSQGSRAGHGV